MASPETGKPALVLAYVPLTDQDWYLHRSQRCCLVVEIVSGRHSRGYRICRLHSVGCISPTRTILLTPGSRVWDPQSGECLNVLSHNHIVKAVSFPVQRNPQVLATGGQEKKLRIWDLSRPSSATSETNGDGIRTPTTSSEALEIGAGDHTGSIKSVVWNVDYNIITTAADDKTIRWYDLRQDKPIAAYRTEGDITSCELSTNKADDPNPGVLSVAAGQSALFFDGRRPGELFRKVDFDHGIASVGFHEESGRFVAGGSDTWVRVWDLEPEPKQLDVLKGHHGPIWSTSFSPDGNIFATGSEDGTIKLWKACANPYGLWR